MTEGSVKERIAAKIKEAFAPQRLEVIDESDRHIGHVGYREGGESHFRVSIVAEVFSGKGMVERHRLVNSVLAEELAGPVHALAISARAPEEDGS